MCWVMCVHEPGVPLALRAWCSSSLMERTRSAMVVTLSHLGVYVCVCVCVCVCERIFLLCHPNNSTPYFNSPFLVEGRVIECRGNNPGSVVGTVGPHASPEHLQL